tara:strand:+ start:888 stop:1067 length:180 start_codon:yes stop_codon:yes gene_type:complete
VITHREAAHIAVITITTVAAFVSTVATFVVSRVHRIQPYEKQTRDGSKLAENGHAISFS